MTHPLISFLLHCHHRLSLISCLGYKNTIQIGFLTSTLTPYLWSQVYIPCLKLASSFLFDLEFNASSLSWPVVLCELAIASSPDLTSLCSTLSSTLAVLSLELVCSTCVCVCVHCAAWISHCGTTEWFRAEIMEQIQWHAICTTSFPSFAVSVNCSMVISLAVINYFVS